MDRELKRLAFIILDVVAIIAILGIVLLDDMSRGYEKTEFQKLITGKVQSGKITECDAIKCSMITEKAVLIGKGLQGSSVCKCPDGTIYSISSIKSNPETDLNKD